jgi:hypothetical protein
MGLQPSASRTSLLLACPWPFDPDTIVEPEEPGEPARYGSAFHEILAACLRPKKALSAGQYTKVVDAAAKHYDVERAREELAGHVKSSLQVLRNWLAREGLVDIVALEAAYAVMPRSVGAPGWRAIAPHDAEHRYDVPADELPGTVDLIARTADRRRTIVIDHKTGADDGFARPSTIPQMRTLGLVRGANEVGIFHADRRGLPIVYAEPYEAEDAVRHAGELGKALGRIGEGFLRAGPHCARCPVRDGCPAHAADLLSGSAAELVRSANAFAIEPVDPAALLVSTDPQAELTAFGGSNIETRAAALYDLLKRFRALDKAASEELRRLVRAGRVIETREGVLVLREQTYETLSKKSVIDALGKIAGEKELARLREKGAIREATREMLVVDKE